MRRLLGVRVSFLRSAAAAAVTILIGRPLLNALVAEPEMDPDAAVTDDPAMAEIVAYVALLAAFAFGWAAPAGWRARAQLPYPEPAPGAGCRTPQPAPGAGCHTPHPAPAKRPAAIQPATRAVVATMAVEWVHI